MINDGVFCCSCQLYVLIIIKKNFIKHYWDIHNANCICLPNARRMKKMKKFETIILAIVFKAQDMQDLNIVFRF